MAIITQNHVLNIVPGGSVPVVVHVSQGDTGVALEFTLLNGSTVFDPTGKAIAAHGIREDGAGWGPVDCTKVDGKIRFTLPAAATALKGSGMAEVTIADSSGIVGTTNFAILVEEATFPNGVTYSNDVSVYEQILAYTQSAYGSLNARIDQIIAPSGEAPNPAEITDARIGTDNTIYPNLGTAIRTQIGDVNRALSDSQYLSRYMLTASDYLNISNKYLDFYGVPQDRQDYSISDFISINEGEKVSWKLRAGSGSSYPVVVIYNMDETLYGRQAYGAGPNTDVTGEWTATKNCFIRICCYTSFIFNAAFSIDGTGKNIYINHRFENIESMFIDIKNCIDKNNVISGIVNGTTISTSASGKTCFTKLETGKKYLFYRTILNNRACYVGFADNNALYANVTGAKIFSNQNNVIEQNDEYYPYIFTVPEGYEYFAVTYYFTGYESAYTEQEILNSLFIRKFNESSIEAERIEAKTGALNPIYDVFTDTIISVTNEITAKATSKNILLGIITDTHIDADLDVYNKVSMSNMKKVNSNVSFDVAINMGDLIDGGEEKMIEKEFMREGMHRLISVGAKRFGVLIGNHDNNGLNPSDLFTDSELYGMMLRANETEVSREGITANSYIDYPNLKIRLVFVDSVYQTAGFSTDTINWVSDILTNLPQGYRVVFVSHEPTRWSLISTTSGSMAGSTEMEAVLTEHESVICGWIHGHTHFDNVSYVMRFPEISITCGKPDQFPSTHFPAGATAPARTIGNVTQDAWDAVLILPNENKFEFVRFGAGNSRTVPFRQ